MRKKTIFYRQCHLVKPMEVGELRQMSWIPEQYAVLGKVLKLRQEETWVDGWVVATVSSTRLEEKLLPDSHKEIKSHRKKTGDAMQKSESLAIADEAR